MNRRSFLATILTAKASAALAFTETGANVPLAFTTQPPTSLAFTTGTPASVPYGMVSNPGGKTLTVALEPPVRGLSVSLIGNQIMLHWDGSGTARNYSVRVSVDDGK